jgi:hypothetical protein
MRNVIKITSGAGKGGGRGGAAAPNILQSGFLDSSKSDVVGGGGAVCKYLVVKCMVACNG